MIPPEKSATFRDHAVVGCHMGHPPPPVKPAGAAPGEDRAGWSIDRRRRWKRADVALQKADAGNVHSVFVASFTTILPCQLRQ
jgi:hypothetical protein